jgi:hypothetical protein
VPMYGNGWRPSAAKRRNSLPPGGSKTKRTLSYEGVVF